MEIERTYEQVKADFIHNIPIHGAKTAIQIKVAAKFDYPQFEDLILDLIAISLDLPLVVTQQRLKIINGKYFDILKIEEQSTLEMKLQFSLVFDVTDCWQLMNIN